MEIERKFLVKRENLPENLEQYPSKAIEQGYLCTEPVVRIRKSNDNYYLTYKSKGLLAREEYNLPLTKEAYEHLKPKADGIVISKIRYVIPEKDGLSIELDVNGGDDDFTFTVILTDRNGDDLENNFYYNGDYTGTIGSGDEITLEGGEKIVIRNLPEGTRYEVIIETADGYTYVIDGEEGVIHTGMNEAEFTATRTVPVADPSVTGVSRWLNTTDHIAYLTGYPGGAFGPDNNMTRAEVAQMFYALLNNKNVTITKTFPDVPADAWYATAVNTLASLGMVSGDENGNYRPNDPITRAEFCVIALAFAYEPENAVCYFGDVSRSDWFYTYVAQAASYGWIGGYTNGNFGPNDRITRAQVTTIVNNMLGRAADRDYVIDHQADLVQFTDLTRAHWGYFQIMEATNAHDYTKSNGTENWR